MRRATFVIGYWPTFLGLVLGSLLSADVAYGFVGPGNSPGSLLAAIANPDRAGNRVLGRMASVVAAQELKSYRPINELLRSRSVGLSTAAITKLMPRSVTVVVRSNRDRFAIGSILKKPKTPDLPYSDLLEKTAGRIREKAVRKHRTFASYLDVSLKGRAGKVFEASEAYRANRFLKQSGNQSRFVVTAVEDGADDVADLVKLKANNRVSQRFQFKSGGEAAWRALSDPNYAGMTIVTHPEELNRLERKLRAAKLKNKPLSPRYARLDKALKTGDLTDEIVSGQKVLSRRSTNIKTENMLRRQWDAVVSTMDAVGQKRFVRPLIRPVRRTVALLRVSRFARPAVKTVKYVSKIGGHMIEVGSNVAVGADFVFAGYGYYDTVTRYQAGRLDHDLMLAKVAVHTGEAGIGTVGMVLLFSPSPDPPSHIAGAIIVGVSVILAAADIALEMVASGRTSARKKLLKRIDQKQRHLAVLEKLKRDAGRVHVRGKK